MSVRNFYMDAVIGGRKTVLTGGPSTKDGGNLITSVFDEDGILMYGNQTIR